MKQFILSFLLLHSASAAFAQDGGGGATNSKKPKTAQVVRGIADNNIYWHAGGRFGCQSEILEEAPRGTRATRYLMQDWEVLVLRKAKTGALMDVYVRVKDRDRVVEEIELAYITFMAGVYENETGRSAFGRIEYPKGEPYHQDGDPGSELHMDLTAKYGRVRFSDVLYWGMGRIKRRNDAPADAPPGWGGHGAIAGPTKWNLHFSPQGLEVQELEAPMYCDTNPAFGEKFVLKKIRSAYADNPDPWAVASKVPLVRDLLIKLSPVQMRAILAELKARHADGSPLSPLEKLNQELIKTML